jgi:hypothetical protein
LVKPVPAIVTLAPAAPDPGENDVNFGSTLKIPTLSAVPAGVTTVTGPVEASAGTTAFKLPGVTLNGTAATPSKSTDVAPPNAPPDTVSVAPTAALDGERLVTFGFTDNGDALVAVPPGVVTVIAPLLALAGTVSLSCVGDSTENPAVTPFTFTDETPPNPVPSTVTVAPAAALPGAKPVIVGTALKVVELVAVPPAVVTETTPLVAVSGTCAVI